MPGGVSPKKNTFRAGFTGLVFSCTYFVGVIQEHLFWGESNNTNGFLIVVLRDLTRFPDLIMQCLGW